MNDLNISTIRSGKGDCIHIRFRNHNLIVDSGPSSTAGEFRNLCNNILAAGESLDALIITHYDEDHIGGILKVGDLGFKNIYFNSYDGVEENENLSASQNQRLFHSLPDAIVHPSLMAGDVIEIDEAKLTIHAPTQAMLSRAMVKMKEADVLLAAVTDWNYTLDELMNREYPNSDTSVANQASIVFTIEYGEQRMLFCGDAWAENIPGGSYNLVKLPHHGSIRNITDDLLTRLDAHNFLIYADGTRHPNKQTIAKLLAHKECVTIYSNYDWWMKGFLLTEDIKYIKSKKLVFKLMNG